VALFQKLEDITIEEKDENKRVAGYFKKLREKEKWRCDVTKKWVPLHYERLRSNVHFFNNVIENEVEAAVVVGEKEEVEIEEEKGTVSPLPPPETQPATPWEFYGIDESVITFTKKCGLFAQMSKGHPFPRKIVICSAKLCGVLEETRLLTARRWWNHDDEKPPKVFSGGVGEVHKSEVKARVEAGEGEQEIEDSTNDKAESIPENIENGQSNAVHVRKSGKKQQKRQHLNGISYPMNPEYGMLFPVVQLGQTLFQRERSDAFMPTMRCRYKVSQKSVALLLELQTRRRIELKSREDFLVLLKKKEVSIELLMEWVKNGKLLWFDSLSDEVGGCLVCFREDQNSPSRLHGITCLLQAKKLIVQAKQDDIDEIIDKLSNDGYKLEVNGA